MGFKIIGTGSAHPERAVSNDDLSKVMDTSDEWISQRTGIRSRYISQGETGTFLASEASKKALEMAGVSPEEIDLIVVGTVSADMLLPSTACLVQAEIGAVNAIAFDVNAACSGFLFGLQIADGYFAGGHAKTALVIGVEVLSKIMDWNDRGTCVLFGDGAGAAVIRASENAEDTVHFVSGSDGSRGMVLACDSRPVNNILVKKEAPLAYTYMDGQAVFKFAVSQVPKAILELLAKSGESVEDIDVFLLHQANQRIIESISKRLKISIEKCPMTIAEYGNVSAASVPILLDVQVRNGTVKKGDRIVMSGFGAGLTWAAAVMTF